MIAELVRGQSLVGYRRCDGRPGLGSAYGRGCVGPGCFGDFGQAGGFAFDDGPQAVGVVIAAVAAEGGCSDTAGGGRPDVNGLLAEVPSRWRMVRTSRGLVPSFGWSCAMVNGSVVAVGRGPRRRSLPVGVSCDLGSCRGPSLDRRSCTGRRRLDFRPESGLSSDRRLLCLVPAICGRCWRLLLLSWAASCASKLQAVDLSAERLRRAALLGDFRLL